MEKSTAQKAEEYIREHPDIKSCLKKGLINYSALSRKIAKDLGIEKKTTREAILIACRRYRHRLQKEINQEKEITNLLAKSEIQIKSKINSFTMKKSFNLSHIDGLQRKIMSESGTFYVLEGSDNYTIITQEKYAGLIKKELQSGIIKENSGLVLVNIISPKEIERTRGVIAFLTSLFSENGVNIVEFFSCWTDTLFLIRSEDLNRTIEFLKV